MIASSMTYNFTFLFSLLACGQIKAQQPLLQLAPPQTESSRLFAQPGQAIAFDFRLAGAEIRYTTDGSEPVATSSIYKQPVYAFGLAEVKAKSFKQGFEPSATTSVSLLQPGDLRVDSLAITPPPKKYMANGWQTLCDGRLGDGNFQANWLGFEEKAVTIQLFFGKKTKVSKLAIGYLRQQGAWIFGPSEVQVFDAKGRLLASQAIANAAVEQASSAGFISIQLSKGRRKSLTIKLLGLPMLPDWHPGKGSKGWIFLDEVVVYK